MSGRLVIFHPGRLEVNPRMPRGFPPSFFSIAEKLREAACGKTIVLLPFPECGQQPKDQVKIAELIVCAVICGAWVFAETQSNYMFGKWNNMILAGELDWTAVEAYMMTNGTVKKVDTDDLGMIDNYFGDTSQALYEESLYLIDLHNGDEEGRRRG